MKLPQPITPCPAAGVPPRPCHAFTLLEILVAMTIFALVLTGIYGSWTAILRASKSGQEAAASVQRSRIVLRVMQDSLCSVQSFALNQQYYSFVAENGDDAKLSFVARLARSFPRSGKFGDLDLRRVEFALESSPEGGRELVLRQAPLVMGFDKDEKQHPLVLAKNVREFSMQFWDVRKRDWEDKWINTNQIPKLVMFTLKLADNRQSSQAQEEITRIVSIPSVTVLPIWQMPRLPPGQVPFPGQPGAPGQPGVVPSPVTPPGALK